MFEKAKDLISIRSILTILLWIIIVGVFVLIPSVYFLNQVTDQVFRDSAMGNWFASIVGVLVGVPIALGLDRSISSRREKHRRQQQEAIERARRTQFLQMLCTSLQKNYDLLEQMERELAPNFTIFYNVDIQLLESTSSLKYEIIDDLDLNQELDSIRYELLHLHREVELQLEVSYGGYRVAGGRQNFIQARTELATAIIEHIPSIKSKIEKSIAIMKNIQEANKSTA